MIKFGAMLIFAIQIAVVLFIGWVIYSLVVDPSAVATAIGSFFGTLVDAFQNAM